MFADGKFPDGNKAELCDAPNPGGVIETLDEFGRYEVMDIWFGVPPGPFLIWRSGLLADIGRRSGFLTVT